MNRILSALFLFCLALGSVACDTGAERLVKIESHVDDGVQYTVWQGGEEVVLNAIFAMPGYKAKDWGYIYSNQVADQFPKIVERAPSLQRARELVRQQCDFLKLNCSLTAD